MKKNLTLAEQLKERTKQEKEFIEKEMNALKEDIQNLIKDQVNFIKQEWTNISTDALNTIKKDMEEISKIPIKLVTGSLADIDKQKEILSALDKSSDIYQCIADEIQKISDSLNKLHREIQLLGVDKMQ